MSRIKAQIQKIFTESNLKLKIYPKVIKGKDLVANQISLKKRTFDIDISIKGIKVQLKEKKNKIGRHMGNALNYQCALRKSHSTSMINLPIDKNSIQSKVNGYNANKPNIYNQITELININKEKPSINSRQMVELRLVQNYIKSNKTTNYMQFSSNRTLPSNNTNVVYNNSLSSLSNPKSPSNNGFSNTIIFSNLVKKHCLKGNKKKLIGKRSTVNLFEEKKALDEFSMSFDLHPLSQITKYNKLKSNRLSSLLNGKDKKKLIDVL